MSDHIQHHIVIKIYENTPVQKIESGRVTAANGKIVRAKYVLICADRFTPKLDIARQDVYGVQTFLGVTNALSEAEARRSNLETETRVGVPGTKPERPSVFSNSAIVVLALFGIAAAAERRRRRAAAEHDAAQADRDEGEGPSRDRARFRNEACR